MKDDGLTTGVLTTEAIDNLIKHIRYQKAAPVPFVDTTHQKKLSPPKIPKP